MKTIILASGRNIIGNSKVKEYLPKPLRESKILYITTAINKSEDIGHVIKTREKFKELGLNYAEYDIEGKTEDELREALANCDIAYVEGGSTFYLLKIVRETGFDKLVKEAIDRGVVYWGASAGAYLACPSVVVSTWSAGRNTHGLTDFTALDLVPFVIKAHYTPEMEELMKEKAKGLLYPLRILTDNQGIIIRDRVEEFIGGEEITI